MTTPSSVERAWKLLALALVGLGVVLVNFDPILAGLPDIPKGGGLPVSETAKQSLALAVGLLILATFVAAWVIVRPGSSAAVAFAGVVGSSAVAALVVFLIILAVGGDSRQLFALATLTVIAVAAIAALVSPPSFSFANISAKPLVAVLGAIVLLIGYGLILNHMFSRAGTEVVNEWERLIALFAGVEAIAFAAVGAILGSEVQKTQTAAETARADSNEHVGQEIADAAEQGIPVADGDGDQAGAAPVGEAAVIRERIDGLRKQLR